MREVAGGVVLEERVADEKPARQAVERIGPQLSAGVRRGEALRRFENAWVGGEPAAGEERREQSGLGGAAGMQRLGHRAERRLEAGGLRAGDPERVEPPLLVEPEEVRTRRRGTEGADGGRRVEARAVVAGPEQRRQTTLELDAGHQRGEKVRAASTLLLGEARSAGTTGAEGWPLI